MMDTLKRHWLVMLLSSYLIVSGYLLLRRVAVPIVKSVQKMQTSYDALKLESDQNKSHVQSLEAKFRAQDGKKQITANDKQMMSDVIDIGHELDAARAARRAIVSKIDRQDTSIADLKSSLANLRESLDGYQVLVSRYGAQLAPVQANIVALQAEIQETKTLVVRLNDKIAKQDKVSEYWHLPKDKRDVGPNGVGTGGGSPAVPSGPGLSVGGIVGGALR